MQFPVPQYTDVEDRIIGNVTVKQFFILLACAVVIFFSYSLTKDYYVTGAAAVLVGIPGVIVAFMPFNGRPMYVSVVYFLNYWTGPKLFIFRKQAMGMQAGKVEDVPSQVPVVAVKSQDTRGRLKAIQSQLEQRASQEEQALASRLKQ